MEVAQKIQMKLERILNRLKVLQVIQTFKLEIKFCNIDNNLQSNLIEIDSILKKCLRKIITKPRKAEIRNIITELIRKKNLSDVSNGGLQDGDGKQTENSIQGKDDSNKVPTHKLSSHCQGNDVLKPKTNCDTSELKYGSEQNLTIHKFSPVNVKQYLCELCGELLNDVLGWKVHKRKHLTASKFECKECLISFPSRKKLQTHNQMHKSKFDLFVNEFHNKNLDITSQLGEENFLTYASPFQSSRHLVKELENGSFEKIESNSTSDENKFTCDCGKVFRLLKTLKKHRNLKHSSKTTTHNCTVCKKTFAEKGKLNRHLLSHKRGQYQCSLCFKLFSRSDVLKRHLSLAHYSHETYSCSFCKKTFNLKYNRDVHEENIHRNVNNWIQCEHCGNKFRNKITFKSHVKIHLMTQVTCSICNRSFNRKTNYKNHMKNKHFGISPFQKLLDSVTSDFGD